MSTTIRANRRRLDGDNVGFSFQLPIEHREQMSAIARYRRWPESEAFRQAIIFFLREHRDLLQVISSTDAGTNGHRHE